MRYLFSWNFVASVIANAKNRKLYCMSFLASHPLPDRSILRPLLRPQGSSVLAFHGFFVMVVYIADLLVFSTAFAVFCKPVSQAVLMHDFLLFDRMEMQSTAYPPREPWSFCL